MANSKNPPYYSYMPRYADFRDMMQQTTQAYGDKVLFCYREAPNDPAPVRITYASFYEQVRALGTSWIEKGLRKAHVALVGKLSYAWHLSFFSLMAIGATVVPLDPDWEGDDLCDTIRTAECKTIVCDGDTMEKLAADCLPDVSLRIAMTGAGDPTLADCMAEGARMVEAGNASFETNVLDPAATAEIVFTSGTTGKGKGVMLTQNAILSDLFSAFAILKIGQKTVEVLPPHHTYGSTIGVIAEYMNGSEVYISSGIRFLLQEMQEVRPNHLCLVPLYLETFYRRIWSSAEKSGKAGLLRTMVKVSNGLRKIGLDLRRLFFKKSVLSAFGGEVKHIICGGAPLSQDIIDAFDAFGVRVINGYGITECAPLISANRECFVVAHSVGVPIPGDEVIIKEPNEDGEGEICVRGPNVMTGYYRDPEATAEAIDADGFFHTGDLGRLENGILYVTGRKKNLIILSNGKNVYPEEIENALMTAPGISEIVVYEGESRRGAEHNVIVAEIYPDAAALEQYGVKDAQAYFHGFVEAYNRRAVPYKKIGMLRIREIEFPKNTLRKIMRFRLDRTID